MRYSVSPAWTYVMLAVMGVLFAAGGFAFYGTVRPPAGAIVGTIWLLMGAGMTFFSVRTLVRRREDDRLRRTGLVGRATIVGATTTGMVINGVPQWKLDLRIEGAGAPYETSLKLQTYSPPSNGATCAVRIDPVRRSRVVLADDDGGSAGTTVSAAAPGIAAAIAEALRRAGVDGAGAATVVDAGPRDAADTVRLLADLDRMHADGTLADDEFESIKRRLLA